MHRHLQKLIFTALIALTSVAAPAQSHEGQWVADSERSVDNDPWRHFEVALNISDDSVTIDRFWRGSSRYTQADSITVPLGQTVDIPVRPGKWMYLVHIAVFVPEDATRSVTANLSDDGNTLTVTTEMPLETAQGDMSVTITSAYTHDATTDELILTETRSTRRTGPELQYTFVRE